MLKVRVVPCTECPSRPMSPQGLPHDCTWLKLLIAGTSREPTIARMSSFSSFPDFSPFPLLS
jgi:hypothetical protein